LQERADEGFLSAEKDPSSAAFASRLNREKGACERDDHQKSYGDAADHRPKDRPVQHGRTSHKTRQIGLEPKSNGIVVENPVQDDRSIDDPVQARNQDGNIRRPMLPTETQAPPPVKSRVRAG